jgi:GntR family transcriptional regulator/MocR family aminotransferase
MARAYGKVGLSMRANQMQESQTNLAWDTLLDLGEHGSGPCHERLTQAIRAAIRAGKLPHGGALPPSRKLAADLGCSRWVVTQAYQQLVAEGYLVARVGSATRVRWPEGGSRRAPAMASGPARTPRYDLSPGLPDLRAFPRRAWVEAIRAEVTTAPYAELAYTARGGHPRLRQVLAEYLQRVRGAVVRPEDVTITSGVTDGVTQVCRALVAAGAGSIAVEDPGWHRLREAASGAGLVLAPVGVDEHGMRVEELLQAPGVTAAIVTPAHQFPTGSVLAPARRAALVEWARQVDALVLEDDYDAEFRYDRRPVGTVQGMDSRRVALFGSLSKTLAPALSLGWAVTPPRWTRALRSAEMRMTGPPVLDQLALARFIEAGSYDRHLRSVRQRYRARRDRLVQALGRQLPDCSISGIAAGLHIVVDLPPGTDAAAVVVGAAERGVRVMNLSTCRAAAKGGEAVVLGYGNLDDRAVEQAVRELAAAVRAVEAGRY